MHIQDGILPPSVWLGGAALAGGAVASSLRRFRPERITEVGVLTSLFFVASSIHFPIGGIEVHLIFNGLVGIVLGEMALTSLAVALFLQAILLGEGGVTTLGINTLVMGGGALVAAALFRSLAGPRSPRRRLAVVSFAAASGAVVASAGLLVAAMFAGGRDLGKVALFAFWIELPAAALEGVITASIVLFLARVRPEVLDAARGSRC